MLQSRCSVHGLRQPIASRGNCLSPAPYVFLLAGLNTAITLLCSMLESQYSVFGLRPPIASRGNCLSPSPYVFLLAGLYTAISLVYLLARVPIFSFLTTNRKQLYMLNHLSPTPSFFLLVGLYTAITFHAACYSPKISFMDLIHQYKFYLF